MTRRASFFWPLPIPEVCWGAEVSREQKRKFSFHLENGWDENAHKIFADYSSSIEKDIFYDKESVSTVKMTPLQSVFVYSRIRQSELPKWWRKLDSKFPTVWEPKTFQNFFYLIDKETILVDFGTWIGPTILFGGQIAASTYGIEGDPAAYAEARINLNLNSQSPWVNKIHLQPACISAINESLNGTGNIMTMHSSIPGNSCSGLGNVKCGKVKKEWKVK